MKNKIFAVKKGNEFWAVIDCGEVKAGGMTTGNYWSTHFKKAGRSYRWYDKLFTYPPELKEWDEISVITKQVTVVEVEGHLFEGWEDAADQCYTTLQKFSELIGHPMSLDDIRNKILTP